jgi:WhiB family redox-sensing transcriptional regulator
MFTIHESWRTRAACRPGSGVDPELFFPVASPGTTPYKVQAAKAKSVCADCPVRGECLESALAVPSGKDYGGIQGGMDEAERAAIRKRRRGEAVPRRLLARTA